MMDCHDPHSPSPLRRKGPPAHCDLVVEGPIRRWDEAMPLGCGLIGCLVWGDGAPLRFALDRGDLWDERAAPETKAADFNYSAMIRMVEAQDQEGLLATFDTFYVRLAAPTKLPFGALELDFGRPADRITSRLNLAEATLTVQLWFGRQHITVQVIVHATEQLVLLRLDGCPELPRITAMAPDYTGAADLMRLGYPAAKTGGDARTAWFRQTAAGALEYGLIAAWREETPGQWRIAASAAANLDRVGDRADAGAGTDSGAGAGTSTGAGASADAGADAGATLPPNGPDWFDDARETVRRALGRDWHAARQSHVAWWRAFWHESYISICEAEYEQLWYRSNYLFGSCSRRGSPPMPLQGVWTADDGTLPPWKGDYHHDLNTQMSYSHYPKAGHLEEGLSFLDFLWNLRPVAADFARDFYDAPGICMPSTTSLAGQALGGWAMYCYSLTNQIWLCQSFDNHWRATGDQAFLRERAYPYLAETAACVEHWLAPRADGRLSLPLSSSPEINDNRLTAWITPTTNYDVALLIYLFQTLREMAAVLGDARQAHWAEILSRLPDLAIDPKQGLLVAPDFPLSESHRHMSHAMAIYPLRLLRPDRPEDRAVIDATVARLERLGTGLWCGYSFSWMASLYALQGNGEGAAWQLHIFQQNFCSPNGFHLNGDYQRRGSSLLHYRPFTLEGNMGAAAALQEMLLQTDGDAIRVFPAIPERWRQGGAGFCLRGSNGLRIAAEIQDGDVLSLVLTAEQAGCFSLVNPFAGGDLLLERLDSGARDSSDGDPSVVRCEPGEVLVVPLQTGESRRLSVIG